MELNGRHNKHSQKKKKAVMDSFEKYPELTNPVMAARHHVALSTISRWKKEYKEKLAKAEARNTKEKDTIN